jgi:hypothetical protein
MLMIRDGAVAGGGVVAAGSGARDGLRVIRGLSPIRPKTWPTYWPPSA